jgi:hypothetical protein
MRPDSTVARGFSGLGLKRLQVIAATGYESMPRSGSWVLEKRISRTTSHQEPSPSREQGNSCLAKNSVRMQRGRHLIAKTSVYPRCLRVALSKILAGAKRYLVWVAGNSLGGSFSLEAGANRPESRMKNTANVTPEN